MNKCTVINEWPPIVCLSVYLSVYLCAIPLKLQGMLPVDMETWATKRTRVESTLSSGIMDGDERARVRARAKGKDKKEETMHEMRCTPHGMLSVVDVVVVVVICTATCSQTQNTSTHAPSPSHSHGQEPFLSLHYHGEKR